MIAASGVGEISTFALAWYFGPARCSKTFTATTPRITRPTINGIDRRNAAFSASAPPEVIVGRSRSGGCLQVRRRG
jgi:hypothetical protein